MNWMPKCNSLEAFRNLVRATEEPLVGLCYYIYTTDNVQEPYSCILCTKYLFGTTKKGGSHNMRQHALSKTHMSRFLEIEYPSVLEEIDDFQKKFGEFCETSSKH